MSLLFFAVPHSEYQLGIQEELTEIREEAVELAAVWLAAAGSTQQMDAETRLLRLSERNRLMIQIQEGQDTIRQFGTQTVPSQNQLEQALAALNGSGTVSDGTFALFGTPLFLNGTTYQIHLYNPEVTLSFDSLKVWAVGIGFLILVVLLFIIFLTNRFLTRFVFRRVSEPLQTLAEGVRQIRDGNLTHRISYAEPDEFQPVCEDFNEMAQRLRASVAQSQREEESRKELLAGISHDIRSPLTSIRAYVEGLLDGVADTPEKQKAYLSTIQKKTVEIDQMVRKLFLFSKMDMGEYPYSPEKLDAGKEIQEFVLASSEEYRRHGLEIIVGPLPQNAILEADPTYFRSILMNLLDNSAKYKTKESGTASIQGEISGQELVLYVDDDGPGVPAQALPKLFDVFYRNDPSRKNPNQGSGLGLAIVSKTMERMKGSIRAENLPQGGLRMVLKILWPKEGKSMKRILIIEDDETIAAIERDYLVLSEFEVDIAATGNDGIAKGRSGRYDLILLDLRAISEYGFTVCRTLRETLDIPILMVTARQEDIDKIKGLGMGADDYITKPFSPNVLVARIKANLAQYDRLKHAGSADKSQIRMGNRAISEYTRRVFVDGTEVELKNKEYELLLFLMSNADIVFSKETYTRGSGAMMRWGITQR